jgi:hypothetical protein
VFYEKSRRLVKAILRKPASPFPAPETPSAFGRRAQQNAFRCDAVIRVYDDADGNVSETHEHKSDFKEW